MRHRGRAHAFDEADRLSDKVRVGLPSGYTCRVFRSTSGDSGKDYWINLVWGPGQELTRPFAVCQCHDGFFKAPLSMLAIPDGYCKHVQDLLALLPMRKG